MIGKTVSHYKILEKLGEGGMGVVYKAEDTKLKRTVALKFLPEELLCDSESKARFIHEAQAASALNHPNITTIYEIDEVNQKCFISMEYIEGNSLKELIYKRTLAIDEILAIALKIAEGLKAAHKKEIVHRDVKSDNVMVTVDGEVKIMDFGLAKLKGVTKLTKTGTTLGTMQYMSPEQAQGMEVDHRSDIFSFGVVLYEMITGQLPFKGEHEAAVIYSIVNETPEPLARYKANVPEGLQRIVEKVLQKDVSTRYQSVAEVIADLKELQKETTTGVGVKAILLKRRQRLKQLAWGIALLLLAGIAVYSVLVLKPLLVSKEAKAKSLAVLSFENLGTETDAYLASGLAEDLAIKLRKLAGFRVASSEDIRRLNKEELLPKQIASRLKVEYALGGSLLKAGDRIRVNVEVIEQASGEVIWSEQFHRKFTDIHEFHDEVSLKIAKALKVRLSTAEQIALKERPTDSPEAYDHYLKGRHYYYNVTFRDNELGEREFERALQLDRDYPLALAGLADAYVQRYKERFDYDEYWLDSAEVLIDRALSLESDLAEAYESRAELLLQEDNITGALEAAEKAKKLRPDWDEPYIHLGNIYQGRGERSKALAMFDTALSVRPSVDALCGKGNILQIRGQMESAKAAYLAALKFNPDHDRPYLELGGLYEELHEGEKADSLYQRAIEVRPDHATGYAELADKLCRRGNVREGEALLRSFVERYPYNWDTYEALYDYLEWIEDYANAVKIIEEAIRRNPERVWPHLLLAISHARKLSQESESDEAIGAPEKAILAIDRALTLRPNSGRVLESAGHVYTSLNRPDEAMHYYDQAVRARPGSGKLLANIALHLLRIREYGKAAEFALEAVQQSPGISRYYFILRHTLAPLNRWQEFFEIINQAAVEYPDDPDILYYLAQEQCVAGLYDEAISVYKRALEIKDDHITLSRLAFALWLSGDMEAALVRFREAKDSYASGHWIVAILRSEGRYDEIEDHLESIKVQSPDHKSGIDYWVEVAAPYYESMRRYDDALAIYTEYFESGEETLPAEKRMGFAYCYRQKGEFDSARLVLEDFAKTSAATDLPWILIGLAQLEAIVAPNLTPALRLAEKAQAQLSIPDNWVTEELMRLQYASGQTDEAMKSLAQLGVGFSWASYWGSVHYRRAQLAASNGLSDAGSYLDDAIQSLTHLARGDYGLGSLAYMGAGILPYRALALIRAGGQHEAIREIKRAIKMEPESADVAYCAACAYSLIGDTALALQWIETAVERGHQELWWARVDPDLDPLRDLPRFQEIMKDWDTRLRKLFD